MAEKEERNSRNRDDDGEDPTLSLGKKKSKTEPVIAAGASSAVNAPTQPSNYRDLLVPPSPPKFINFEDILQIANGVDRMALAHEIAVGNDFRLQHSQRPDNSIAQKVRETMHKAFWDVLEAKLNEDPPDYSQALLLLQEVKENLLELLFPQNQTLRVNIEEVLDLQLIEQKAEHGTLDISYYASYVIGVMSRMCAPVRDEEIAALKQLTDIVTIYKEIFKVLDLMKLDMANFTISAVRPYVQQHSVMYEREKFSELLKIQKENGIDGLQFTRAWITKSATKARSPHQNAASAASAGSASLVPESSGLGNPESERKWLREIMNAAFMDLLEWSDNHEIFPETLLVDQQRFISLRNKVKFVVLVSSVVIVTYNTVGQAIAGIASLKEKLKDNITILISGVTESQIPQAMANVAEEVNKEVNKCLEEHSFKKIDSKQEQLLKGQILAIVEPDNAIFKIMKSRLFTFIATILVDPKRKDIQIPTGFSLLSTEITELCGQFLRLVNYNRSVFGSYYADLVQELFHSEAVTINE